MHYKLLIAFAVIFVHLSICESSDLILGSIYKNKLHTNRTLQLPGIAGVVRSEFVDVTPRITIKAIRAIDLNKSRLRPNITSGGLGYGFVSIKFKSDRGKSLRYRVEVYV